MLKKLSLPLAAAALLSLVAASPRPVSHRESFLPPNDLKHQIGTMDNGVPTGISEEQFNAVMDRMQEIYGPIVASHGGHLVINRLWTDDTVNASAEQQGSDWVLNMYGGLARDKAITQDGMALVACHEMGHHLGGAPKYGGDGAWAADEGEADYYANSKCLHRVFAARGAQVFSQPRVAADDQAVAKAACAKSYRKSSKDQAVCLRSAMAGQSVTALFTELSGDAPAHFDTPDPTVVAQTNDEHPASQCRLDTYYQASLCTKSYAIDMSPTDPAVGACVRSQGYATGLRPLCWYAPPAGESSAPLAEAARPGSSPVLASLNGADVFSGL